MTATNALSVNILCTANESCASMTADILSVAVHVECDAYSSCQFATFDFEAPTNSPTVSPTEDATESDSSTVIFIAIGVTGLIVLIGIIALLYQKGKIPKTKRNVDTSR